MSDLAPALGIVGARRALLILEWCSTGHIATALREAIVAPAHWGGGEAAWVWRVIKVHSALLSGRYQPGTTLGWVKPDWIEPVSRSHADRLEALRVHI